MPNKEGKKEALLEYSVVVPAYKEAKNVPLIYQKLTQIFKTISNNYEIIFVNDGSPDNTLDVIKLVANQDSKVKYLSLSRNFGHQAALTAGLDYAKGQAIISMDCDLQDPPEIIPKMIRAWKDGYEVVYARRKNYRNDNLIKRHASRLYYNLLYNFGSIKIPRNVGDFRLIDRKVLDQLKGMKEKARYLRGMVAWLGFKHAFVDYVRPDRINGKSQYTLRKLANLAMEGLLNFSTVPLKLGFVLGALSIFFGFAFMIYMIGDALIFSTYYHLYKWLSVVFLIYLGLQFIFMYLLGEYIWRIYNETRNRPLYVIRESK